MAVNVQKLLPPTKGSSLAKVSRIKVSSPISIRKKTIDTNKLMKPLNEDSESSSIQKTLSNIDSSLKLLLKEEQKQQSDKRKQKEKQEFEKEEKKLEAPKESKKFKLPGLSVPGMGFLDRIKRFIFFTALGWLFTKFQDQLPKLVGIVKTIVGVYKVAEDIFKFLLNGLVNFIDIGYQTYDGLRKKVEDIGGKNAVKTFDEFSSHLNKLINGAIMASMLIISTAPKKPNAPSGAGAGAGVPKPTTPKPISGFGGGTEMTPGRYRAPGQSAARGFALEQARKGLTFEQSVAARQAAKVAPAAKGARFGAGRIPIIGPLITFVVRTAIYGEKPEKAAAAAIGMGLGQAIGTFIGGLGATALGLGTAGLGAIVAPLIVGAGSVIGGLVGEWIGAKLYDFIAGMGKNNKPQPKAAGGSVTRGGKTQGGPSRTIKIARRKPPKIQPKQSQPGKDVGGKKKIRTLYPDPSVNTDIEGNQKNPWFDLLPPLPKNATAQQIQDRNNKIKKLPNPYKALTGVAKKLKDIPFGIGALMGGAIDIALGEKLQPKAVQSLSNGISYLIGAVANQQISSSIRDIEKEIAKMQTGGSVPRSGIRDLQKRSDVELGRDVNKVLSGFIQNKVDEAIREVQKQLMPMKYDESKGSSGGGGGGGGGGQIPPTGKNGRYSRSELTYVGKMNPAEILEYNDWYGRDIYLRNDAAAAFKAAQKEAGSKIGWILNSGYRSLKHQQALIDLGYPAAPLGYSNHGDGVALDVQTGTNGHAWLVRNGAKFGWIWPNISGDAVHFYYNGSYAPKGQEKPIPEIFKQEPKRQPGQLPEIFDRPGLDKPVRETGQASWYGPGFYGNRTASGEVFREGDTEYTAAHKTLPFGTKVTVRNKTNGKSIQVRINDRGPFKEGRIIDLNKSARDALGGQDLMNVDLSYQGGGYIPKQPPKKNIPSLSKYPSYSSEGGMMIAIQPVIVEKRVPIPSSRGKGRSINFIGGGSVNNNMQGLSRG